MNSLMGSSNNADPVHLPVMIVSKHRQHVLVVYQDTIYSIINVIRHAHQAIMHIHRSVCPAILHVLLVHLKQYVHPVFQDSIS